MPYILFDLIIAAILIFAMARGYARGLVLTLCGVLALFVAFLGATLVSNALAQPAADLITPAVERSIQEYMDASAQEQLPPEPDSQEDSELEQLLQALRESPLYRGFVDAFESTIGEAAEEAASHAVQSIAAFIAVQVARMVLFFLSFVAILIAWFILSHALDLVTRLPVLNGLNRWTGAAAGLIKGALLLYIAAWLLRDSLIPPEAVENTWLLKFFCTTSPLSLLVNA